MKQCHYCNGIGELPDAPDWKAMLVCTCIPGTGSGHATYDWQYKHVWDVLRFDSPELWPVWGASENYHISKAQGQPQGYARLSIQQDKQGRMWTAVCCWDRTGDPRMRSNTTFACPGVWKAEELLAAAAKAFPPIIERLRQARSDTEFGLDVREFHL